MTPSETASDSTFQRRAYLDVIGCLPTPDETRTFLADASPSKRKALVDRLLERPEYADFWASKWADLLRPNAYRVGIKATLNLDAWLRDAFRRNLPYDQFVRELVTAQGSTCAQRRGHAVPRPPHARRNHHYVQPTVSRHSAGMRKVPPPSFRGLGPERLLRPGRLLRPHRPQGRRHLGADLGQ